MKIAENKVASFHYSVKNEQGDLIDESKEDNPLIYLHGHKNIVPGLEEAMEGREVGDKFEVIIPAEKAYGERTDKLVQRVPRSAFQGVDDIQVGMRFNAQTEQGDDRPVIIIEVDDDSVVVDGNHLLAGVDLHFSVNIIEVRDSTEEEQAHGHAHDPGGHNH